MRKPRVAVLAGGLSFEREVSLRSGQRVAQLLQERGYEVSSLDVDQEMPRHLSSADVAFMALHGGNGEDGVIQSLLEFLKVPYTGSAVYASALAWQKPIAKGVFEHAGLHTPEFLLLSEAALRELGARRALQQVHQVLGLPVVVKPATGGSALGVRRIDTPAELPGALLHAMAYSATVMVERYIEGIELAMPILDGTPLPAVEIEPLGRTYDYVARYTHGATRFHLPARLDEEVLARCRDAALRAWEAIGARQIGRVDLIVDSDGMPWVLEFATCPGLTETSVWPLAVDAAGVGFGAAVERLVHAAVEEPKP